MLKKTTFTSVAQMVRETSDDGGGAFADALEERLRSRRILKDLMVLRAGRGLSQGDVAAKMGCTQSRISKLESSKDADLSLGVLAGYASAVGCRVKVVLLPGAPENGEPPLIFNSLVGETLAEEGSTSSAPRRNPLSRNEERGKVKRKLTIDDEF
jgi:transcriptional regulator with XRE-family HTH domain